MLAGSLDAIRQFLKTTVPAITKTYIQTVPAGFKRPSFLVDYVTDSTEDLNRDMYQERITWQVVYFAPRDSDGIRLRFNQITISDQLKEALRNAMTLTSPELTEGEEVIRPAVIYHIRDVEGGPRDDEVYMTVQLEAEFTRPRQAYDLMQEANHVLEEG
jgi:hypothetical protein